MKKLMFVLFVLAAMMIMSCAKEPIVPISGNSDFTLKFANAVMVSGDSLFVKPNTFVVVFVEDASGNKVMAEFDFGNNTAKIVGNQAAGKYTATGLYHLSATVKDITPKVVLSCWVVVSDDVVVPPSGETAIILISSSVSGVTNFITLGLRGDIINGFNSSLNAEVQGEIPNVNWSSYPLTASSIVTVNGIKYFKWSLSCVNGKLHFGWLQGNQWAFDQTSIYRQSDGLYTVYVNNGQISDIEIANNPFTLKVTNYTSLLADTIFTKVNTLLSVSVLNINGNKVTAEFDFGNGNPKVTTDEATDKYTATGLYHLTVTVKSVSPNVVLTRWVKVSSDVIVPPGGETAIILIAGNLSGTTNFITLGLRCDIINGFNPSLNAEAQGELPSVNWNSYPLAANDIVIINNIKYFKWNFSCVNGRVRFSWLQGNQWAYDPTSIYRQNDGLYIVHIKDGKIYSSAP